MQMKGSGRDEAAYAACGPLAELSPEQLARILKSPRHNIAAPQAKREKRRRR
jgi:hypothetical protein